LKCYKISVNWKESWIRKKKVIACFYTCAVPSVNTKCIFCVTMARGDKVENHCSRESNSQQYCSFVKHEVSMTRTARWTRSAPFNLFYYAQYFHAIQACVCHKITSFQFFRLHFWCILISSKLAKRLFLLMHPQFSNIVVFGEEHKLWSSWMLNSLLYYNAFPPSGPLTPFSTSFSDIMKDLPNHMNISEEENLLLWKSIGLNWKIYRCNWQHLASEVSCRTYNVFLFICCLLNINCALLSVFRHGLFSRCNEVLNSIHTH